MGDKQRAAPGHRVFFALPVEGGLGRAISEWRRGWPIDGRWVPERNFHLTLAFLGEVPAERLDPLLDSRFDGLRPFALRFGEPGYFAKPKVLFLAPFEAPEALLQLASHCQRLQQRFGNAKKEDRFQAHITLARHVQPPIPPAVRPLQIDARFARVCLYESRSGKAGVEYTPLAEWPLRNPLRPSVNA
jgi:2'-5' RNA ligase